MSKRLESRASSALLREKSFFSPMKRSHTFLEKSFERSIKLDNFMESEFKEKPRVNSEKLLGNEASRISEKPMEKSGSPSGTPQGRLQTLELQKPEKFKKIEEFAGPSRNEKPQGESPSETKRDLFFKAREKDSPESDPRPDQSVSSSPVNPGKQPPEDSDIQSYIREQEAYLARLEEDRERLRKRLDNDKKVENSRKFEETAAFIQELHQKENSFRDSGFDKDAQRKADLLLERFLGGEKNRKENTANNASDLSYSLSQEQTPEKSLLNYPESLLRSQDFLSKSRQSHQPDFSIERSPEKMQENLGKTAKHTAQSVGDLMLSQAFSKSNKRARENEQFFEISSKYEGKFEDKDLRAKEKPKNYEISFKYDGKAEEKENPKKYEISTKYEGKPEENEAKAKETPRNYEFSSKFEKEKPKNFEISSKFDAKPEAFKAKENPRNYEISSKYADVKPEEKDLKSKEKPRNYEISSKYDAKLDEKNPKAKEKSEYFEISSKNDWNRGEKDLKTKEKSQYFEISPKYDTKPENSQKPKDNRPSEKNPKSSKFDANPENDKKAGEGEPSLAEVFMRKKAKLAEKMEQKRQEAQEKTRENAINSEYKSRTKEEILKLRKEMMKKPEFLKKRQPEVEEKPEERLAFQADKAGGKTMPVELMQRLAMGGKVKVGKSEMKALTSKNYEKLPEVVLKKKQEAKKEDFRKRQENMKRLEMRLRETMKK